MGGDYLLQGYVFFNFLLLFFYSFLFFFCFTSYNLKEKWIWGQKTSLSWIKLGKDWTFIAFLVEKLIRILMEFPFLYICNSLIPYR